MATNISFEHDDDFGDFSDLQETEILSKVVRRQAKYGSTSSHTFANQKCISHLVQPSDTLQGLALKYHVSMEQIRRANRMYTSDSLFLRPTLKIPTESDPNQSGSSSGSGSRSSISNQEGGSGDTFELTLVAKVSPLNGTSTLEPEDAKDEHSTEQSSCSSKKEQSDRSRTRLPREESIDDFLSRIDTSIAKNKGQVVERSKNSFPSSVSMDQIGSQPVRHSASTDQTGSQPVHRIGSAFKRVGNRRRSLEKESSFHPVAIFNNGSSPDGPSTHVITKGVRSSLRRLEKEKDDLFQL